MLEEFEFMPRRVNRSLYCPISYPKSPENTGPSEPQAEQQTRAVQRR